MNIKIPWEAADQITLEVLKDARKNLKADLKRPARVFSDDEREDKLIIKDHIKALNLIIKYFTV